MIAAEEAKADNDRELKRDRIVAQDKDREAEEAKLRVRIEKKEKDTEIELAKIVTEKDKIAAERDVEMARIESDKELKFASEIELEKFKHSFEMEQLELTRQLGLQRASFKTE